MEILQIFWTLRVSLILLLKSLDILRFWDLRLVLGFLVAKRNLFDPRTPKSWVSVQKLYANELVALAPTLFIFGIVFIIISVIFILLRLAANFKSQRRLGIDDCMQNHT